MMDFLNKEPPRELSSLRRFLMHGMFTCAFAGYAQVLGLEKGDMAMKLPCKGGDLLSSPSLYVHGDAICLL
jgi:hypothetical protein